MPRIDYFWQASSDHAKSTVFGGLISIVCLIVSVIINRQLDSSSYLKLKYSRQQALKWARRFKTILTTRNTQFYQSMLQFLMFLAQVSQLLSFSNHSRIHKRHENGSRRRNRIRLIGENLNLSKWNLGLRRLCVWEYKAIERLEWDCQAYERELSRRRELRTLWHHLASKI